MIHCFIVILALSSLVSLGLADRIYGSDDVAGS